jgi:hypothetical protein
MESGQGIMECVRACVCVGGGGCIFHVPVCLTHTSHGFEIDLGSQTTT